jgi:hypothetical protein
MHIDFDFLGDAQKLALAKTLRVAPNQGVNFSLDATVEHADQLLLAARVHCLSKVCRLFHRLFLDGSIFLSLISPLYIKKYTLLTRTG